MWLEQKPAYTVGPSLKTTDLDICVNLHIFLFIWCALFKNVISSPFQPEQSRIWKKGPSTSQKILPVKRQKHPHERMEGTAGQDGVS